MSKRLLDYLILKSMYFLYKIGFIKNCTWFPFHSYLYEIFIQQKELHEVEEDKIISLLNELEEENNKKEVNYD